MIFGLPGSIICLGGGIVSFLGMLADSYQLKLDTNIDRSSVIMAGGVGMLIGLFLLSIPVIIWIKGRSQANK